MDRKKVGAIAAPDLHAECFGAAGDIFGRADRIFNTGMFRIMVVFEQENTGRLRDDRHVHCLERGALIAGTVAGKGDGNLAFAVQLGR